jgi:hypothetical protein
MSEHLYETWGSDSERDKVIASQNLDGYEGTVYRSEGHGWNRF